MIQANDGGANVSFDGGRTWSTQMNQPTAEIYGVWLDNQFPYNLYGAQQDNSTLIITSQARPVRARGLGAAGPAARPGRSCRTRAIPNIVYGSCKGQYSVMNLQDRPGEAATGSARSRSTAIPASDLIYRDSSACRRWRPRRTIPDVLYYGSQYVHRTRDKGVTWEKISPDLTAQPGRAARAPAASRSRATSPARSSTARSTRSPSRRSSAA